MNQHTGSICVGSGNHAAGHFDGCLGDGLRLPEFLDFIGTFLPPFGNSKIEIAYDLDSGLAENVGERKWQGSICDHGRNSGPVKTFRSGLRRGDLPICRESTFRSEVGGNEDLIGRNGFNGTIKLNIPNDADRAFLFDFEIYERVSDSELCDVEKRAVVQGNAGADCGSGRGRHG